MLGENMVMGRSAGRCLCQQYTKKLGPKNLCQKKKIRVRSQIPTLLKVFRLVKRRTL